MSNIKKREIKIFSASLGIAKNDINFHQDKKA